MAKFQSYLVSIVGPLVFAGTIFGQVCGGSPQAPGTSQTLNVPPILDRYEDTTALVSDVIVSCPASVASTGVVIITMNEPVTSKPLQVSGSQVSDATLQIIQGGAVVNAYPGAYPPGGTQITFSGVSFPASTYTLRLSNIRVNSSAAPNGTTNFAITESIFVTSQGVAVFATPAPIIVGYVVNGFSQPVLDTSVTPNPVDYLTCTGNPVAAATVSFSATVKENFGGAFKAITRTPVPGALCGGAVCSVTNGEEGSYTGGIGVLGNTVVAGLGSATHGTRFELAFSNVPQNIVIYLPTVISNGTLTVTLGVAGTGSLSPLSADAPAGSTIPAGYSGFRPSNGTVRAWYDVTATDNTVLGEAFTVTGYITAPANFAATGLPPVMLTIAPAPSTPSADIPTFNASSNPVLILSAFRACQTNLLFPYISSQLGFDTGIAISNTGVDGLVTGGAKGTAGTCSLSFYGTGLPTPSTQIPVPFASTLPVGSTGVFLVSSVAVGFQGYMIAQCGFIYAHGFAFIVNGFGTASGISMGYLANTLPAVRSGIGAGPEGLLF
jgi:hypothetical protein